MVEYNRRRGGLQPGERRCSRHGNEMQQPWWRGTVVGGDVVGVQQLGRWGAEVWPASGAGGVVGCRRQPGGEGWQ